jgi:type I restriction enzyme M protein
MRRPNREGRGRVPTVRGSSVERIRETWGNLGFEAQLWPLRGSMDAAEYKQVVLGLILLNCVSDAFEEHRKKLLAEPYADPEDPEGYRAENIFWVRAQARWSDLRKNPRQPTLGEQVDRTMEAVDRQTPLLKGVLPKDYVRPVLNKQRLGQLIDLISNIHLGGADNHARDIQGWVYDYFVGQFPVPEGGARPEVAAYACKRRFHFEAHLRVFEEAEEGRA